jgi:protein-S-isoprenylcysteine O-methyltransferase Ste14
MQLAMRHPSDSPPDAPRETAGVAVRPPLLCLAGILLGAALQWALPLPLRADALPWWIGAGLVAAAVALFATATGTFVRAGTPIPTNRPTRRLVRRGPYAFSRNPIYVSFVVLQVGLACWIDTAWLLVTLVPVVLVLEYGVIRREERYLAARLGAEYGDYARRVRRWI